MLLLTQLNRGGLLRLNKAEGQTEAREKSKGIDVTVFQKYNALYEKPTCCLVGYADAAMRLANKMTVYPVKLRNRPIPEVPVVLPADYKHSKIGGAFESITGAPSKANTAPMKTASDAIKSSNVDFDPLGDSTEEDIFSVDDLGF